MTIIIIIGSKLVIHWRYNNTNYYHYHKQSIIIKGHSLSKSITLTDTQTQSLDLLVDYRLYRTREIHREAMTGLPLL